MKHADMGAEGGWDKTKQSNSKKEDGAPENKGIGKMNVAYLLIEWDKYNYDNHKPCLFVFWTQQNNCHVMNLGSWWTAAQTWMHKINIGVIDNDFIYKSLALSF